MRTIKSDSPAFWVPNSPPRDSKRNSSSTTTTGDYKPDDQKAIGGDAKMDPVESVTKIFSDPNAGNYIAGSAWHCYYGDSKLMAQAYNTIHQRFPDKEILCTELVAGAGSVASWWGDVD